MSEEILGLMQCWHTDMSPREQTMSQNIAEQKFDWYIQQAKDAGLSVSPVKRSMSTRQFEDRRCGIVSYFQRAKVEGSEEAIQQLKAQFERIGQ